MTRRRILPLVALAAFALQATPAAAKTPRVTLRLPSPGHLTIAALELDATADKPGALPRRVTLGAPRLGKLPPDVKVLFATRSLRIRHGRRYAAIVFVVRKAGAAASVATPRAHIADTAHEPDIIDLIFEGGGLGWSVCRGCGRDRPIVELDDGTCSSCFDHQRATSQLVAIQDADRRKARKLSTLNDLFKRDFTQGGDPAPVFGGDGRAPDPTLETGHYDDGHSFGWGTPPRPTLPPADVTRVEIDLVEDLMERQPAKLVPDLEVATAVDLNGDGAIGVKQQVDTRVGPIVIT
jgi:hypothetical protein